MKNIIGKTKRHANKYSYLSLSSFPADVFKTVITQKLIQKANKAQFLLGKLSGITILLPDVDYFISSYIAKDATSSSQIEGTKATIIDAFEYAADPSASKSTDADDIAHYIQALNHGLLRLGKDGFPFSLRFIKELHKELMNGARSSHFANPGEFRKTQNWIGGTSPNKASFVPPAPEELSRPLKDLEKFIHTPFIHPVIDAGLLHSQFETIHPFLDGNGRTGRLLITFYFIHNKCLEMPALFLSSYFKNHQKFYYQCLSEYHDGNCLPWLDFFVDAVIATAEEAIDVSRKVTELRDQDLAKISKFAQRTSRVAMNVIQKLYREPIVSSTTVQKWIDQTKPGTIKFIDKLQEANILELYRPGEGTRPSLYAHREYIKIFVEK